MEHRCSKCGAVKPVEEFPRRSNWRPQCYCYPCWNTYHHERYLKNKAAFVARAISNISRLKRFLRSVKDVPCMDCGRRYPFYVMEHDHRDGETKLFNISDLISKKLRVSMETLKKELAKCDVVCANCHRERTYQRGQRARQRKAFGDIQMEEQAAVAQSVEHLIGNEEVLGSNPNSSSTYDKLL
jgi:hypothetical protein